MAIQPNLPITDSQRKMREYTAKRLGVNTSPILPVGKIGSLSALQKIVTGAPTPPVPPTPVVEDKQDQLSVIKKRLLESYSPTAEETQLGTQEADISKQLADLSAATQAGILGKEGQGRGLTTELVSGQQEKMLRQAGIAALPLSAQLANIQAKRELEASKRKVATDVATKEMEFETKRLERETAAKETEAKKQEELRKEKLEQSKPFTIGNKLLRMNPNTGAVEELYSVTPENQTATITEYNLYKQEGGTNDFIGFLAEKKKAETIEKPEDDMSGMPNSWKEWQLAGGQGEYSDWVKKTGLRPLPASQATTLSEGFQIPLVTESLDKILTDEKTSKLFGPIEGQWAKYPWDVEHKTIDDDLRRASQVIGRYMEGGVLRKEDEEKYRRMLPQITDKIEVAKDKLEGVKKLLAAKSQQYLSDYESAGFDVSGFVGKLPGTEGMGKKEANTLEDYIKQNPDKLDQAEEAIRQGFTDDEVLEYLRGFKEVGSATNNAQKIASAIKSVESGGNYQAKGGSGEFGAYQFMPSTWKSWAGKYLGNTNAPMTPENQDKVALAKINELLKQGYDAKQIALIWNGGSPTIKKGVNKFGVRYDTGAYANKVLNKLG